MEFDVLYLDEEVFECVLYLVGIGYWVLVVVVFYVYGDLSGFYFGIFECVW